MRTFSELEKKYDAFRAPAYEILVGSHGTAASRLKKLQARDFPILSLTVTQSVGHASSAQISFLCEYNFEKGDFMQNVHETLAIGNKIAINLGYSKPELVFVGMIKALRTDFSSSGITVAITCYDAKAALFHNVNHRAFPEKSKLTQIVKEVLEPCAKYANIKVAGNLKYDESVKSGEERTWKQDHQDDYKFVQMLAKVANASLYTSGEDICFTDNIFDNMDDNGKTKVKLAWYAGLMSFSVEIDISKQVGAVKVAYRDTNEEVRYLTFNGKGVAGSGKLPEDTASVVKGKSDSITQQLVDNEKQAELLAQSIYISKASNYVVGRGQTIGLPDIRAGEVIELGGLGKTLNGRYFLSEVIHRFDGGGYLTSFTCQRAKI